MEGSTPLPPPDPNNLAEKRGLPRSWEPIEPGETRKYVRRLKPWYTHITDQGFAPPGCDLSDPRIKPMLAVGLPTRDFHRYAELEWMQWREQREERSFKDKRVTRERPLNAKTLWIGGMMGWVVNTVYVVTDDTENLFTLYYIMNQPDYLTILGRLLPDHEFTMELLDHMSKYGRLRGRK